MAQEAGRKYVTIASRVLAGQMSDDAPSPENDAGPSVPAGAVSRDFPSSTSAGLHARASAKFVQMVERFNAEVWVTKGSETVGGTSIMGLMMLSAGPGTSITVSRHRPRGASRHRGDHRSRRRQVQRRKHVTAGGFNPSRPARWQRSLISYFAGGTT